MGLRGEGGGDYQHVHLEAFAAVTNCALPWALGKVRAGRGGRGDREEERVSEKQRKKGSVRVFIVFSCD